MTISLRQPSNEVDETEEIDTNQRQTGRTTRLLQYAVDIAENGTVEESPESWRLLWAWFLTVISFGYFSDTRYLENYTVRKIWRVYFVMNVYKDLSYLDETLREILVEQQTNVIFRRRSMALNFRHLPNGGNLQLIPLAPARWKISKGDDVHVVFDHSVLEDTIHPEIITELKRRADWV